MPATLPVVERQWTDFTQGALRPTGNPTDLALSGKGFFAVNGPNGPLYTRNGNFRISASGGLTTAEGYPVRLEGGSPAVIQTDSNFEIALDGTLSQAGQAIGKLQLADFSNAGSLVKIGRNYFSSPAAPAAATALEVRQGKLENSNVSAPEAAVRLVSIMRQFEMLQKAVQMAGEMNRKSIEEVARVGS
jgi:flagellar basal body rod protein FlgG